MAICLPVDLTQQFKEKLKSGAIDPIKMAEMNSAQRRESLSFLGENNAAEVNALYESKLLLKNQQQGMITWIRNVAGLKTELKRDMISQVNRMDEALLTPESEQDFLEDLAAQKLGVGVTMEETGKIAELAALVSEKEAAIKEGDRQSELEYGQAVVAFTNYVTALKQPTGPLFTRLKDRFMENPLGTLVKEPVFALSRTVTTAVDVSYTLRQGSQLFFRKNKIWRRNALKAIGAAIKEFKGTKDFNFQDMVDADIISRKNARNGRFKKMGLDVVGLREEEVPSDIPEKIPGVRRLFKASNAAFTVQAHLNRADLADQFIEMKEKVNEEVDSVETLRPIGILVNSMTGRGSLGELEKISGISNLAFFSLKFLKSNIDSLGYQVVRGGGSTKAKGTAFVRKQAAINTLTRIGGIASILGAASLLGDDDTVEFDATSANFGKIKIGDTRIDVTGGAGSIAILAARLLTGRMKSSVTGITKELNTGEFASKNKKEVLFDFFDNKTAPALTTILDILEGSDFDGKKPTIASAFLNMYTPISFQNFKELEKHPDSANILLATILDVFGAGTNTYNGARDWNNNTSAELQQFKDKVGQEEFDQANDEFNKLYNDWFKGLAGNSKYEAKSNEDRQKELTKKRKEIKRSVFKKHKFKPK